MEIWDVYDKHCRPTGKTAVRGEPLGEGEYHLTVHICIFTPDGRLLIQQRAHDKSTWPSLWDITAAGSVLAGESVADGAHRELFEEIGLSRDFESMRPSQVIFYPDGFGCYFTLTEEPELSSLTLQREEVAAVRYATLDEVLELLHSDNFIPYHESFVRFLFDLKERQSTHSNRRDLMYGKRNTAVEN